MYMDTMEYVVVQPSVGRWRALADEADALRQAHAWAREAPGDPVLVARSIASVEARMTVEVAAYAEGSPDALT